jgi:hypothetical protein
MNLTKNIINYANDSNLSITSVQTVKPVGNPNQQPNKISLVPTKLLLKPQQQSIAQQFKQPTLIYSSAGTQGVVTTTNSSSIPMKVVFVNTNMQNSGNKILNKTIATLQQNHTQQIQQYQIPVQKQVQPQIQQQSIQKDASHINNNVEQSQAGASSNKPMNRDKNSLANKFPGTV